MSELSVKLLFPVPVKLLLQSKVNILGWPRTYLICFLNVLMLFALITESGKLFHILNTLTAKKYFIKSVGGFTNL